MKPDMGAGAPVTGPKPYSLCQTRAQCTTREHCAAAHHERACTIRALGWPHSLVCRLLQAVSRVSGLDVDGFVVNGHAW